jgi:hypothetical protein
MPTSDTAWPEWQAKLADHMWPAQARDRREPSRMRSAHKLREPGVSVRATRRQLRVDHTTSQAQARAPQDLRAAHQGVWLPAARTPARPGLHTRRLLPASDPQRDLQDRVLGDRARRFPIGQGQGLRRLRHRRPHSPGQYEVDHLVPLEAGGSNQIANLFPEPASPRPGFHEKDRLENAVHDRVCDDRRALRPLQRRIAADWVALYDDLLG